MATNVNLIDVALGTLSASGYSLVQIAGKRSDIGATEHDVWTAGESGGTGVRVPPAAAGVMSVVSTSTDDAAAGTGARKVQVDYLDADWAQQSKVIEMNGTVAVVTVETGIRVHLPPKVVEAGSNGTNVGAISVSIGGAVQAHIAAGLGQGLAAWYTVPALKKALLLREWADVDVANAIVRLYHRYGAAGSTPARRCVREFKTGLSNPEHTYRALPEFGSKTDLVMRASISAGAAHVAAGFDLLLVNA